MTNLENIYRSHFDQKLKKILDGFQDYKCSVNPPRTEEYCLRQYIYSKSREKENLLYVRQDSSMHEIRSLALILDRCVNAMDTFAEDPIDGFFKSDDYHDTVNSLQKELDQIAEKSLAETRSQEFLNSPLEVKAKLFAEIQAYERGIQELHELSHKFKSNGQSSLDGVAAIKDGSAKQFDIMPVTPETVQDTVSEYSEIVPSRKNTKARAMLAHDYLIRAIGGKIVDESSKLYIEYLHFMSAEEFLDIQDSRWKNHIYRNRYKNDKNWKQKLKDTEYVKQKFKAIGIDFAELFKLIDDDIEYFKEKIR